VAIPKFVPSVVLDVGCQNIPNFEKVSFYGALELCPLSFARQLNLKEFFTALASFAYDRISVE
jgi:hypothetical protein